MTISRGEPSDLKVGRRSVYPWEELAGAARDNPGEWFSIKVRSRSYASFLTAGKYVAFNDVDNWEVTTRASDDGGVDLYVRYHPEGTA